MEFLNVLKRLVLPINQKHEVPYDAALETFIPSVHKRLLYRKIDLFLKNLQIIQLTVKNWNKTTSAIINEYRVACQALLCGKCPMTNPNNYQFGAKKTLQKVDSTDTSTANLKISNTGSSCSNKNKIKWQMLSTTQNKVSLTHISSLQEDWIMLPFG